MIKMITAYGDSLNFHISFQKLFELNIIKFQIEKMRDDIC